MKLYKYHPINIYLLHSLRNKTNWYSKLHYLNDPYDCFFIDKTNTNIYKDLKATLCVCCFSRNMNEILMWSHYADNHRGVCLEWEINYDKLRDSLFDIQYTNDITILDKIELTNSGHLSLNAHSNGKFILTKFENWKYEQEMRTYRICEDSQKVGEPSKFLGELTAIYFGRNASQDDISLVKHNTLHYSNLEYYKVDLEINTMKNNKLIKI